MNGRVLWVMVPELASIELMFHLVTECDFSWDHVKVEMQKRGVLLPETIHPLDLCPMSNQDISNTMKKTSTVLGTFFSIL